jgi:regulator of protease activity HflC (stomatin/prohibitin superfamily)
MPSQNPNMPQTSSTGPGLTNDLDQANQSLGTALRQSFRVLKLLMLVLVVLYFLSGWFSVKPNEVGVIVRYGRIVGADEPGRNAVLGPGWYLAWPYPIDRFETVSINEREMPVHFMFSLSEEEVAGGEIGYKYNNLYPERDDYLITGDVNILHASLLLKYRVSDAVAYLRNVRPTPEPYATVRSDAHLRYPEYAMLNSILRDAVIETAASRAALDIRGNRQDEFLMAVASKVNEKLKAFEKAGVGMGISVDPVSGVLAPKSTTLEAILPPRQTQEAFDRVFAAQNEKSVEISKATSEAQSLLFKMAGTEYESLAKAIDEEYALLVQSSSSMMQNAEPTKTADLRARFEKAIVATERALDGTPGNVQAIVKEAQIRRDRLIREASGDYEQFASLLPEYLRNPDIFISRLSQETFALAMDNKDITKVYVPPAGRVWLQIPRVSGDTSKDKDGKFGDFKSQVDPRPTLKLK